MEDDTHLHDVCKKIIELDDKIRFVGIPNKFGKQIVVEYRKGLDPLLTDSESELYAIETVIRMNTRKDFELKLGKPVYSFTLYDIDANHESIILENIIPYIKKELA